MLEKVSGFDISKNSIAVVQTLHTFKGFQITACAYTAIQDDNNLNSAFNNIFEQIDIKNNICHASISGEYASYRNLQLPFKEPRKIKQALIFELEALVPFPVEDIIADFILIDYLEQSHLLSACIKKSIIAHYLKQLSTNGVNPDILDIRCVPTVSWLLKHTETPENGIFLQIDGERNTMIIFHKNNIILVRAFFSDNTPALESALIKTNNDSMNSQTSEQITTYYQLFCTKIKNTIHDFEAQNNIIISPEKILFSGKMAVLSDTKNHLTKFLNIPAEQIDLSVNNKIDMTENAAQNWNPALMNNALALSLRKNRHDQGFNFRKDQFKKKKIYFGSKKEIRRTALLFIILICFLSADTGIDFYFLNIKDNELSNKITEVFKKTLPEVTRIPRGQEVNILKSEIYKISKSTSPVSAADYKNSVQYLLKDILQRIPAAVDLHLSRMIFETETVRFAGYTDAFSTVDKIKNSLESSDCFKSASISSAKLGRTGNKIEFEIKLDRAIKK